eukprot:TRINITY_DN43071_c0_g1_i1.p1 TRINITY_DN43071_c0_g1~~TRINITY_DN43071_c0_g1_i1.p1  ORF type:complete len:1556 (+),score=405.23 TRINITY_DN43071_c0_g1_i1:83-4669(+)
MRAALRLSRANGPPLRRLPRGLQRRCGPGLLPESLLKMTQRMMEGVKELGNLVDRAEKAAEQGSGERARLAAETTKAILAPTSAVVPTIRRGAGEARVRRTGQTGPAGTLAAVLETKPGGVSTPYSLVELQTRSRAVRGEESAPTTPAELLPAADQIFGLRERKVRRPRGRRAAAKQHAIDMKAAEKAAQAAVAKQAKWEKDVQAKEDRLAKEAKALEAKLAREAKAREVSEAREAKLAREAKQAQEARLAKEVRAREVELAREAKMMKEAKLALDARLAREAKLAVEAKMAVAKAKAATEAPAQDPKPTKEISAVNVAMASSEAPTSRAPPQDDAHEAEGKSVDAAPFSQDSMLEVSSELRPAAKQYHARQRASTWEEVRPRGVDAYEAAIPAVPVRPTRKSQTNSVEARFEFKNDCEHVRARPEMYVGAVEIEDSIQWVVNDCTSTELALQLRTVSMPPALLKIVDEVIVNASDHFLRGRGTTRIEVVVTESGKVSVRNDGDTVPVLWHSTGRCYTPEVVFGLFRAGSNFDDAKLRATGGRNGIGSKATNALSTEFQVECGDSTRKLYFVKRWRQGMAHSDPHQKWEWDSDSDVTKVTFRPDFKYFCNTEGPPEAFVGLVQRRVLELAVCCPGVDVYLNGKAVPVSSFADYIDGLYYAAGNLGAEYPPGCVPFAGWHTEGDWRWEMGVGPLLPGCGGQISFVNGVPTTRGGTHIDAVRRVVIPRIRDVLRNVHRCRVDDDFVSETVSIFLICRVANPSFNSQVKEILKSPSVAALEHCITPPESFYASSEMDALVDHLRGVWAERMAARERSAKSKFSKKLIDAKFAGQPGFETTLIITEGDSAKALAVAGLKVVGRELHGVWPLQGKISKASEDNDEAVLGSTAVSNMMRVLGLVPWKDYSTLEERETLRYSRVLLMCDQDPDGSHIKALILNLFYRHWPSLVRQRGYFYVMSTPLVKVFDKENQEVQSFLSKRDFREWWRKHESPKLRVKYYKGLGTSTRAEALEYFKRIDELTTEIVWEDPEGQATEDQSAENALRLAFDPKESALRKEWLRQPEVDAPPPGKEMSVHRFVHNELINYSRLSNTRSIPSIIDGLKVGQRKVLATCLRHKLKEKEIKVAQLSGLVAEKTGYAHGEQSLNATIIKLAQDFVGNGNNLPLLEARGQFGTRLKYGADSASPRYIYTCLSELSRYVFPQVDDSLLDWLDDDGLVAEPRFFVPIIPMALVNGTVGIGTGWATKTRPHNPLDVAANVLRMLDGLDPEPLVPYYEGLRVPIETFNNGKSAVSKGEVTVNGDTTVTVTELPVGMSNEDFKIGLMKAKERGLVEEVLDFSSDTEVLFEITLEPRSKGWTEKAAMNALKLSRAVTNIPVFVDSRGNIRQCSFEEVVQEHYDVRLEHYERRLQFLLERQKQALTDADRKLKFFHWFSIVQNRELTLDEALPSIVRAGAADTEAEAQRLLRTVRVDNLLSEEAQNTLEGQLDAQRASMQELEASTPKGLWRDDLQQFIGMYKARQASRLIASIGSP